MLQWLSVSLNSLNLVKVSLHLGKTPLTTFDKVKNANIGVRKTLLREIKQECISALCHAIFKVEAVIVVNA